MNFNDKRAAMLFVLLILCFGSSTLSSRAMSAEVQLAYVDCNAEFGWLAHIQLTLDQPLINDDGLGHDYTSTYYYVDYVYAGGGFGAWTVDATYPQSMLTTVGFSDGATVSFILVDETAENPDRPLDYASVMARDEVIAEITIAYDDVCGETAEEVSDVVMPPDERINWQYGDLNAILYRASDEAGNPALHLYCYDGENGSLALVITAETLADAPLQAPGCNVVAYLLDNAQIQINITDREGKLYEIICDDLACNMMQMRYFDPNE